MQQLLAGLFVIISSCFIQLLLTRIDVVRPPITCDSTRTFIISTPALALPAAGEEQLAPVHLKVASWLSHRSL